MKRQPSRWCKLLFLHYKNCSSREMALHDWTEQPVLPLAGYIKWFHMWASFWRSIAIVSFWNHLVEKCLVVMTARRLSNVSPTFHNLKRFCFFSHLNHSMNECLRAEKGGDQHRSRKYQQNSKATKEIVATQRKKKSRQDTALCNVRQSWLQESFCS